MTRRRVVLAVVALAGVLCGVLAAALSGGPDEASADDATTTSVAEPVVASATVPTTSAAPTTTTVLTASTDHGPLLVWTTGGLPAGLADELRAVDALTAITLVRGDDVELTGVWDTAGAVVEDLEPGWFIPLDALAVDLATYGDVVPGSSAVVEALREPGSAVLGESAAAVRGVGVGARLEIDGANELVVTAVVPDDLVAAAEVTVSAQTGATMGISTPRSMLVRYTGERDAVQRSIAGHVTGRSIRFRERGETAFLRHGDAVLPQALVKAAFGEFAARHADGTWLELDPAWVERNIVDVDLPVLGRTRCHAAIVPTVERALDDLVAAGLTALLDPGDFGGCFAPRLIGPGLGVSRHAWGVALDVNVGGNPLGGSSTQDARLVEIMRAWGLAWGGEWLRPDPMHFEYLTPPRR